MKHPSEALLLGTVFRGECFPGIPQILACIAGIHIQTLFLWPVQSLAFMGSTVVKCSEYEVSRIAKITCNEL